MFGNKKGVGIRDLAQRRKWQREYLRSLYVEKVFDDHFDADDELSNDDPFELGISSQEKARRLARLR